LLNCAGYEHTYYLFTYKLQYELSIVCIVVLCVMDTRQLIVFCIEGWQLICTMMTTVFHYTHVQAAVRQHNLADKVSDCLCLSLFTALLQLV